MVGSSQKWSKVLNEEITWDFLIKKFNEKYIPGVVRYKFALEFQELK